MCRNFPCAIWGRCDIYATEQTLLARWWEILRRTHMHVRMYLGKIPLRRPSRETCCQIFRNTPWGSFLFRSDFGFVSRPLVSFRPWRTFATATAPIATRTTTTTMTTDLLTLYRRMNGLTVRLVIPLEIFSRVRFDYLCFRLKWGSLFS